MAAITGVEVLAGQKYTVTTGAAGGATAGSAASSLGKYCSTTSWGSAAQTPNDLFPDISGAANAASQVDYVALAWHNVNTANVAQGAVVYLASEVAGGASVALASDNIAASSYTAAAAQLAQTANSTTAPAGVSAFSAPSTAAAGVALGNIPVNNVKGYWVRRTAANTAALSNDGATFGYSCDTGSL